jgi:hypothetical protein
MLSDPFEPSYSAYGLPVGSCGGVDTVEAHTE